MDKKLIENNTIIGVFDGAEYVNDAPKDYPNGYYIHAYEAGALPEDWRYHESWDWLMPVVEKCLSAPEDLENQFDTHYDAIHDALWSINIEETYKEVIEFIKCTVNKKEAAK